MRSVSSKSSGRRAVQLRAADGSRRDLGSARVLTTARSREEVPELVFSLNHLVTRCGCELFVVQREQRLEHRNSVLGKNPFV